MTTLGEFLGYEILVNGEPGFVVKVLDVVIVVLFTGKLTKAKREYINEVVKGPYSWVTGEYEPNMNMVDMQRAKRIMVFSHNDFIMDIVTENISYCGVPSNNVHILQI